MNVLLINHCSTNKGDKAVLEFMLHEFAVYGIKNITVSANEPACCTGIRLPESLQIQFVPWGWNVEDIRYPGILGKLVRRVKHEFYSWSFSVVRRGIITKKKLKLLLFYCNKKFYNALKSSDIVISVGGHHVTSILSPDAVSPQIFEMALTLLAGKPLYLWSQSIGPLSFSDNDNSLLIGNILSRATAIYSRDKQSIDELNVLGIDQSKVYVTCETVLGYSEMLGNIIKPSARLPVIGISVYSIQKRTVSDKYKYVKILGDIVDYAVACGYAVKFFPMQMAQEHGDDRPCIDDIVGYVMHPEMCSVYSCVNSMKEHIEEVSKCCMFIGHKTHSVIISLITGTPIIALAYHQKTKDFMSQYGLSKYCIDDSLIEFSNLVDILDDCRNNMDAISSKQLEISSELGRKVRIDLIDMLERAENNIKSLETA